MKNFFLILLLLATAAQAETYKWTDKEGTVHFSESLGEVPANYRKSAKPLEIDASGATVGSKAPYFSEPRERVEDMASVSPQVEGLKERMLKDEGIMALIRPLQDDPEMQALLKDPAVVSAVQAGDIGTLLSNPRFMKLLNNPRVREIEKKMKK